MVAIKPLGKINEYEAKLIKAAVPELQTNIEKVRPGFVLNIPYRLITLLHRAFPSSAHLSFE